MAVLIDDSEVHSEITDLVTGTITNYPPGSKYNARYTLKRSIYVQCYVCGYKFVIYTHNYILARHIVDIDNRLLIVPSSHPTCVELFNANPLPYLEKK